MSKTQDLIPFRKREAVLNLRAIQQTKTYSLTVWHTEAVKELSRHFRRPEGEIVRMAIESLLSSVDSGAQGATASPSPDPSPPLKPRAVKSASPMKPATPVQEPVHLAEPRGAKG